MDDAVGLLNEQPVKRNTSLLSKCCCFIKNGPTEEITDSVENNPYINEDRTGIGTSDDIPTVLNETDEQFSQTLQECYLDQSIQTEHQAHKTSVDTQTVKTETPEQRSQTEQECYIDQSIQTEHKVHDNAAHNSNSYDYHISKLYDKSNFANQLNKKRDHPLSETTITSIVEDTIKGDVQLINNHLDDLSEEKCNDAIALAVNTAISHGDDTLAKHLLARFQTSSKTSSKVNILNNALVCLYECIDKNNAIMTHMILSQINMATNLKTQENPFDDIFRRSFQQGCQSSIVVALDKLWNDAEQTINRISRRSGDSYSKTNKITDKYARILEPLLKHIGQQDRESVYVYIIVKHGLIDFDDELLELITMLFPKQKEQVSRLADYLHGKMPTDPSSRKYYFEYLFSTDPTPLAYERICKNAFQTSTKHSFKKVPYKSDFRLRQNILTMVEDNMKSETAKTEATEITNAIKGLIRSICSRMGSSNELLTCESTLVGSSYEGTRVYCPNEFDFFIRFLKLTQYFDIFSNDYRVDLVLNQHSDFPSALETLLEKYGEYTLLNSDMLKQTVYSCVKEIIATDNQSLWKELSCFGKTATDRLCNNPNLSSDPTGVTINSNRFLTIHLIWRGSYFRYLPISVDIIPGFIREKGFISLAHHDLLQNDGYDKQMQIVAFGNPIGFQLCPNAQENDIIRNLPDTIKLGYIIAKAMRRTEVLQQENCNPAITNIDDYERSMNSYLLKQSVIVLTHDKNHMSERTCIEWANSILLQLRKFLVNDLRIPKYLSNPENDANKECAFKIDSDQINLRKCEKKIMIAMIDRMHDVLKAEEFVDLARSPLQMVDEVQLDSKLSSVCFLKRQLYIGTVENGLQVFDENFKPIGDNQCIHLGPIYGLTPLLNETIVIAADSGLFHINQQGLVLNKVAKGKHIDVSSRDDTICSLHLDAVPCCITLYSFKEKQFAKIKSFPSPSRFRYQRDTVALGSDVIYISAYYCIYKISMDGTLLGTHGRCRRGGALELWFQRALATDENDNLLVCDHRNNRLQVMTRDGKWHIVGTDKNIGCPFDAAIDGDHVYILCGLPDTAQTIYRFKFT